MRALIVYESSFGSTARVAEAVAAGLYRAGAEAHAAHAASRPILDGVDLVVVGAPTHNLGMPGAKSRQQAVERGASRAGLPDSGVAEWLDSLGALSVRAAAFDTAVASRFSGSAAKKIEKRLSRLGAIVVDRAEFTVAGDPPVLAEGELQRAAAWGAALVAR